MRTAFWPAKDACMEPAEVTSEIEHIVEQLVRKYRPLRIILFGSAGRGEYDNIDDLDFLIVKDDVPAYGLDRMRELDELIERNMASDMLVYRPGEIDDRLKLGDPFNKTILREGRVLYG
jgi:predicted nucleotidyltransferase